jgi:hypothetical protein
MGAELSVPSIFVVALHQYSIGGSRGGIVPGSTVLGRNHPRASACRYTWAATAEASGKAPKKTMAYAAARLQASAGCDKHWVPVHSSDPAPTTQHVVQHNMHTRYPPIIDPNTWVSPSLSLTSSPGACMLTSLGCYNPSSRIHPTHTYLYHSIHRSGSQSPPRVLLRPDCAAPVSAAYTAFRMTMLLLPPNYLYLPRQHSDPILHCIPAHPKLTTYDSTSRPAAH